MSARDRNVIGIVAVVVLIAAAWFLLISPKRSELSSLQTQVRSEQAQLTTAESALAAGEQARARFGTTYASMVKLGEAVPTDDNVPSLIYQVQAAAGAARVDFRSLSLSGAGGSSSAGGAAALPPGVTQGPSGFPMEPFSFTFRGSFFHLADFFSRLERFVTSSANGIAVRGRLLTLDAINFGPGPGGFPAIDANVSATAYLLPPTQGVSAGASPAGPSAAAPSQPAPGGSSSGGSSSGGSTPPAAAVTGVQP